MYSRQHRTSQKPTSEPLQTNQFAPKPFTVQPQLETGTQPEQTPNAQTQPEQAKLSTSHWPDVSMFTYRPPAAPPPRVQMKLNVAKLGQREQQEAGTVASEAVSQVNAPQNLLVQRKLFFNQDVEWLNAEKNPLLGEKFTVLADIQKEANSLLKGVDIEVKTGKPRGGVASYRPQPLPGEVLIEPIPKESEAEITSLEGLAVSDRAIAFTHELRHVCDAFQRDDKQLQKGVRKMEPWEELIHSEWRSHASQAKAAYEIFQKTGEIPDRHYKLVQAWKKNTFDISQTNVPQSMFGNTSSYIEVYSRKAPTDKEVEQFIQTHQNWVQEAFTICPPIDLNQEKKTNE